MCSNYRTKLDLALEDFSKVKIIKFANHNVGLKFDRSESLFEQREKLSHAVKGKNKFRRKLHDSSMQRKAEFFGTGFLFIYFHVGVVSCL